MRGRFEKYYRALLHGRMFNRVVRVVKRKKIVMDMTNASDLKNRICYTYTQETDCKFINSFKLSHLNEEKN